MGKTLFGIDSQNHVLLPMPPGTIVSFPDNLPEDKTAEIVNAL
jgi:hypothetical protein